MTIEVKVPSVGESVTEVTITQWLKSDGEHVEMDEPLCEIESDKATVEIPAPQAGALKISVQEGETVEVGAVVASIDPKSKGSSQKASEHKAEEQQQEPAAKESEKDDSGSKNYPSPAAKKILSEKGIDPQSVSGSGKDGRITKADALSAQGRAGVTSEATPEVSGDREVRTEKMTALRKTIAKRLVAVKNETAMLTTFNELDMSAVMKIRKKYKEAFKNKYDVNLGFMSFFTKAVCEALKDWPAINAQISGENLLYHNYCDIGIAVSTPKGLVVPVLRDAQNLNLAQVEKGILDLALKARDGKLGLDEMQGGTFTITNGGVFGSMLSTPIINAPQSAILGMHNIVERPVVVDGKIRVRPIMYLALSYDHRIVDGRESVSFLKQVKEYLEEPARLLLGV